MCRGELHCVKKKNDRTGPGRDSKRTDIARKLYKVQEDVESHNRYEGIRYIKEKKYEGW